MSKSAGRFIFLRSEFFLSAISLSILQPWCVLIRSLGVTGLDSMSPEYHCNLQLEPNKLFQSDHLNTGTTWIAWWMKQKLLVELFILQP